jgi:hypothetical protein
MSFNTQAIEDTASPLTTARYEPAGDSSDDLMRAARQFRLAMIFKVPVGYQDESGFHLGVKRAQLTAPAPQPEYAEENTYQF